MSLGIPVKAVPRALVETTSGRICLAGSALQIPFALFLLVKAYRMFPNDPAETFVGLGLMHIAVVAALFCSWLFYGLLMKKNWLQNSLLILIAVAPMAPTYATLAAA